MNIRDFQLQKAAISDDGGSIAGLAAVFGELNGYGERIEPGAFKDTLAAHAKRGTAPSMLLQHNQQMPVGRWTKLEETSEGLWVEGRVSAATEKSREARTLLTEQLLDGLSIGFTASVSKRDDSGVRIIQKIELFEVSLVSVPAAPSARVRQVRAFGSVRDFEAALHNGVSLTKTDAKRLASLSWKAMTGETEPQHDPAEIERHVTTLFRSASTIERYAK